MYLLDEKKFRIKLIEMGYLSIKHFAQEANIHRNVIYEYLSGKKGVFKDQFSQIAKALNINPTDLIEEEKDTVELEESGIAKVVDEIISNYPQITFILLGSRAKRKHKKYSDWDLGVISVDGSIDGFLFLELKDLVDRLSENLVFHIDLVNLDAAPDWFLEELDSSILFLKGKKLGFKRLLNKIAIAKRKEFHGKKKD